MLCPRKIGMTAIAVIAIMNGCSSQKELQEQEELRRAEQQLREKQKSIALQHFIDGSLLESKGEYAQAILEYQDALRYDKDPAIYYAIAKDYSVLGKHALAAEMVNEAVRRDPYNITYRELLAEVYIKAFQIESAIAQFKEILAIDSTNAGAMYNLARLTQSTRPLQALEMYERILQRSGPDWEVLYQIAEINASLRRYDRAVLAFEQMAKIDPSNSSLKQNLGEMYVRAGQYDKAETLFNDLLELNPSSIELHGALAELYLQKDDWKRAREQFDIILKSDSLSADMRFRVASAYFEQTQKDSIQDSSLIGTTIRQCKIFLQKFPSDWRPMFFLGVLSMDAKDDSSAEKYFDKVTKIASWNANAWLNLGQIYLVKGRFQELIGVMEKARQLVPDNFGVNLLLGIAYSRVNRNGDAVAVLEHAVELNPKDLNALSSLGLVYDALKRYNDCDRIYETALKVDPAYALVLNNYAYSLAERGEQLERAETMSKRSLEKDSLNSSYLDTYGWIHYKLGNYTEAEIYTRKAVESGDASAVVYEHLGDIYSKLDQPEQAKKYWTKALELDASNSSLKAKIERGRL